MKKKLLVFSFIIVSLFSYGQDDPFEKLVTNNDLKPALELFFKGNVDSCIFILEQFDSTHIIYNEICIFKAQIFWEKRDYEKLKNQTEEIYSRISKENNLYLSLLLYYGLALRHTNDNEKAISVFKEGYIKTKDIIYLINLLSLYNYLERYEETIQYDNNVLIDSNATLYSYLGVAYFQLKDDNKSLLNLSKSLELLNTDSFNSFIVNLYLGKIHEKNREFEKAKKYYNDAKINMEKHPEFKTQPKFEQLKQELTESLLKIE